MKEKCFTKTENTIVKVKCNQIHVPNSRESFNENIFHILSYYHSYGFVKKISAVYSPILTAVMLNSVCY